MSFVLVSADFSCCKPEARIQVYEQLSADGWKKINTDDNSSTSLWLGKLSIKEGDEQAKEQARDKFYACFNPNCKPTIVFYWSINEMVSP